MELRAFAPKMFELHAAGEYEAARKLVVDAQPHLPEEDAETVTFWRICLDARTSRTIEALDQIEAALDRGWWYGAQMLADPDLDSIRNDPRFVAVARQSEQAQAAASREPCEPIVTEPIGDVRGHGHRPACQRRTAHSHISHLGSCRASRLPDDRRCLIAASHLRPGGLG